MDAATFQVQIRHGSTVADAKKEASKHLGAAWYDLRWTAVGATQCLGDDAVLDLGAVPEVTSITSSSGDFPFDSGHFGSLVVHGVTGEPIVAEPDEEHGGRLCVSGEIEGWEGEPIILPDAFRTFSDTAVVIAEQRTLTVVGDADVEQDDAYIIGAWNEPVRLHTDKAPICFGWRVRYVADGFSYMEDADVGVRASCPRFGLATKEQLKDLGGQWASLGTISFAPTDSKSAVFFGPGVRGLPCASAPIGVGSGNLPANDAGGFDYSVLMAFDSTRREVRAVVGWGTTGARMDRVIVPADLWPASALDLLPVVALNCEDFCGVNNVTEADQLPISFEALKKDQMPDDAVHALVTVSP